VFDIGIDLFVFEHFTCPICYEKIRKTLNDNELKAKALFLQQIDFKRL